MKLQTKMLMLIRDPTHIQYIMYRNTYKVQLFNTNNDRILQARQYVLGLLAEAVTFNNPDYILKTEEF